MAYDELGNYIGEFSSPENSADAIGANLTNRAFNATGSNKLNDLNSQSTYSDNFNSIIGSEGDFGKNLSQYRIGSFSYPDDLFDSTRKYGGNYVVFYINIPTDSKLVTEDNVNTVDIPDTERFRASIAKQGYTQTDLVAATTLTGLLGGTILGSLGGGGGAATGGAVGGALGFGSGVAVAATSDGKITRQQKRLQAAIALHSPNQLTATYGMQWDAEDTGLFQAAAKMSQQAIGAAKDWNADKAGQALKTGGSAITAAALASGPAGLSAISGLAANPKKEQLFKGVDFRTFTFEYQFAPRDEKENRNVQNIIKMFKLHMHPEYKDEASFIFLFPSEFDIHYYHLNNENEALFKHTSCVLTNLTVNYAPNGNFNTFGDGSPTQINVQMTFKELAILTKAEIKKGF
jgi:hypothetical protein